MVMCIDSLSIFPSNRRDHQFTRNGLAKSVWPTTASSRCEALVPLVSTACRELRGAQFQRPVSALGYIRHLPAFQNKIIQSEESFDQILLRQLARINDF